MSLVYIKSYKISSQSQLQQKLTQHTGLKKRRGENGEEETNQPWRRLCRLIVYSLVTTSFFLAPLLPLSAICAAAAFTNLLFLSSSLIRAKPQTDIGDALTPFEAHLFVFFFYMACLYFNYIFELLGRAGRHRTIVQVSMARLSQNFMMSSEILWATFSYILIK